MQRRQTVTSLARDTSTAVHTDAGVRAMVSVSQDPMQKIEWLRLRNEWRQGFDVAASRRKRKPDSGRHCRRSGMAFFFDFPVRRRQQGSL